LRERLPWSNRAQRLPYPRIAGRAGCAVPS